MSERYVGAWEQAGLFNPLNAPTVTPVYSPYMYVFGANNAYQLGLGNSTNYSSPVQLGALTNWNQPSSGAYATLVVKTDNTLWAWGANGNYGALGLNNLTAYISSPTQVGALSNWSLVNCGGSLTFAIKTNGTLWGWGYNSTGGLGLNNTTSYSSPKQVGALTIWSTVSTSNNGFTLAIQTNGTIWSWGSNNQGQLGLGNTTYTSSPIQIGASSNWSKVATGVQHSLAIKTDGTLWGWGRNTEGQLGIGNANNISSPVQVGSLTNWLSITAGTYSSLAIKTDGTLWAWGKSNYGQLGLNNTNYYSSPKQVGSLTNWSKVITSGNHTVSVKTNGTLWAWGWNIGGELGQGNTTYFSSPKQVGSLTSWLSISAGTRSSFATQY